MARERLESLSKQLIPSSFTPKPTTLSYCRKVIHLDRGWLFRQADGDQSAQTFRSTAMFPTNVHLDLLSHGLIPDPFVGMNEKEVQWVGEKTWVYKCSIQIPPQEIRKHRKAVMVFDGLDTFATVQLNGVEILRSSNMFQSHTVDVRYLMDGRERHSLEIVFKSATDIGHKEMNNHPEHKWGVWNGDPSRAAVRKAQYHYGWDWGPILMTCGPWKPISLEFYNARIADLYFRTTLNSDLTIVEIEAIVDIEGSAEAVKFELSIDGKIVCENTIRGCGGVASTTFRLQNPRLWWPFSYGDQPLYKLTAILVDTTGTPVSSLVDKAVKRFGVRKVELIQRPIQDQDGTSFFFQINNVPIFITGACWIPGDSFTPKMTTEKCRSWVTFARSSYQVMLRVWGGGIFERDEFYDACDELGVLVWQDFMFACGNYPAYPEMLQSIETEAKQNAKLLRHHPSIVIWAGNNEDYLYAILAGLHYDEDDVDPQSWLKSDFPARYIYENLLPTVCKELMPDTPYHPGSPFGGTAGMDPTVGDIHQWRVWHMDQEPYQEYDELSGRFVSEFGMQGFPVRRTVDEFFGEAVEERKTIGSEMARWHNKATGAADSLQKYLDYNLPGYIPTLDNHIYYTQLIQSEALATAYRSWKRLWKGPGREYCGGLLVWQLNDCWPVTSWAVVDYYLRPKMAFWAIKRESRLITTAVKRIGDMLEGWASNLTLNEKIVDVQIKAWDVTTGELIDHHIMLKDFVLEANRSIDFPNFKIPGIAGKGTENVVVGVYLLEGSVVLAGHVNFHEPLKEVPFQRPELRTKICREEGEVWLEVSVTVPVKGLLVESQSENVDLVVWDDNGVDLVPGEVRKLFVQDLDPVDEGRLSFRWLGGCSS